MADRLDVLSMSSPTGQSGPSWDTSLMCFAVISSSKYSWLTTQEGWEALLWSFACCLLGVWPRVDFEGKPFGRMACRSSRQRPCRRSLLPAFQALGRSGLHAQLHEPKALQQFIGAMHDAHRRHNNGFMERYATN